MKRHVTDQELDRLLRAQPRARDSQLAERLAARLAEERAVTARGPRRWWWWAVPAAAAAGFSLWLRLAPVPTHGTGDFETLLALEESLAPGAALLDATNRELCADLPLDAQLSSPENRP